MENLYALPNDAVFTKEEADYSQCYEEFILDDRKSYRCTVADCGKIFRFKSEMQRHNVIHFNSRPYKCSHPGCKKTFKRADALDHHVRVHSSATPFDCDFEGCGQSFTTKAALKYHVLKHNKDKPYKCTFQGCDKSFLTLSQLKQHEKAYNCHSKIATYEEPVKVVKTATKKESEFEAQFSFPAPRMLKEMEWEIKNSDEDNEVAPVPESSENLIKYFISDNNIPNVPELTKYPSIPIISSPSGLQTGTEPMFQFMNEPSVFFNDNEFKFLDFLREVDANDF